MHTSLDPWIFYTLIDQSPPDCKEFFQYLHTTKKSKEGAIRSCDESVHSYKGEDTAILHRVAVLGRIIPFVELIYIGGLPSFGMSGPYDIVVVCNTGRCWIVKCMMQCALFVLNTYQSFVARASETLVPITLTLVCDRLHTDLKRIKSGVGDLMSVYWIAHLSLVYHEYGSDSSSLFDSNRRITVLLPYFPLRSVISFGGSVLVGQSWVRAVPQTLLSGLLGDGIEKILYLIHRMTSKIPGRCERGRRSAMHVGGHPDIADRVRIQRKVASKSAG